MQHYQPKKNGQPSGPVSTYYYVYEDSSTGNTSSRIRLGRIRDGQFIPNENGRLRLNQLGKDVRDERAAENSKPSSDGKTAAALPGGIGKYYPGISNMDLASRDYGEYAAILASTRDVLYGLLRYFHPDNAALMYAMGIIYFIEGYMPANCCEDLFRQSILSEKWKKLSFDETTINKYIKQIGLHPMTCDIYFQSLIDNSSELIALYSHVVMPGSQQNKLIDYGYRYHELQESQVSIIGVYDVVNHRQLTKDIVCDIYQEELPAQDLFIAFRFSNKTFLADSCFYDETNIDTFREHGCHYLLSVPANCVIGRMIREDVFFTDSFIYEQINEDGSISRHAVVYRESTVAELEAMGARENDAHPENARQNVNEMTDGQAPQESSKWGNDRVIIYKDHDIHEMLAFDYHIQIGTDPTHTEEEYQKLERLFGVLVLRVDQSKDALTPRDAYLTHRKLWDIENQCNPSITVRFNGLEPQEYYNMQGIAFLMLVAGQIKASYMDKLRSSSLNDVKNMSLQESIIKARTVRLARHMDGRWYVSALNEKAVELLSEMGVDIEEDIQKLNDGTF